MKICHVCLCGPVTDGFLYQENLLSKYHVKLGYEVHMIASCYYYDLDGKIKNDKEKEYVNCDGVKMHRLSIKKGDIETKFKRYIRFYDVLKSINPDILFVHSCQFLDVDNIIKYKKKKPSIKIYADNHADFANSAKNPFSKYILHGIVWKSCAKRLEKVVVKFYGVTPGRVDFLKRMYGLKSDKLELLVMGADDDKVVEALNINIRNDIRDKYGIKNDDFLIMTGGKIDRFKTQTLLLMEAVSQSDNLKLIVFGSVTDELKDEVLSKVNDNVKYIGWVESSESYKYFAASDLVVFPGGHSVFWEQVAGLGIPMIVRKWDGIEHIDVGGNCLFLEHDSVEEIKNSIKKLTHDKNLYITMKKNAIEKGMKTFSYLEIARRSV